MTNQHIESVQKNKTTTATIAERVNFYVINLDRSTDRMERFTKDFTSFPVPFIRVPAIDGKELTIPIKDYDAFMFVVHMGREAVPGEIGCYLSHLKALKMFLESKKEFAVICEDDAMPTADSYEVIEQAIAFSESWDLLRLYGGRIGTTFPYQALVHAHHLCISVTCMSGAVAYVVKRHAAEILIQKLIPMADACDSALFYGRWGIREATIWPNCVLLSSCDARSTIRNEPLRRKSKPWHLIFWSCRLHRLHVRAIRYSLQLFWVLRRCFLR